jgi:hypothetical protein
MLSRMRFFSYREGDKRRRKNLPPLSGLGFSQAFKMERAFNI